jgi:hypothetical protein
VPAYNSDAEPYSAPPSQYSAPPYSAPPAYHETDDLSTAYWKPSRSFEPGEEAPVPAPRGTRRPDDTPAPEDPPPPRSSRKRKSAEPEPSRGKQAPRSKKSTDDISDEDFWAFMRGEALR